MQTRKRASEGAFCEASSNKYSSAVGKISQNRTPAGSVKAFF